MALWGLRRIMAIPPVRALAQRLLVPADERLAVAALGRVFPSPLGVAAGFDKDAKSYRGLALLGFGFVEVGTATAQPQAGAERPRVFRLSRHRALLNRMGFPNPGAAAFADRLAGRPERPIVAVNVGKTKIVAAEDAIADYRESIRAVAPHADYLVLNVSSPNTPGLLAMQAADRLGELAAGALDELAGARVPLLVKIGPDASDADVDAIVDKALELGLDGIVAVNTMLPNADLQARIEGLGDLGAGGVSGAPIKQRAVAVLRRIRARAGDRLTLVSVGGVEDADDAWERIEAGATLVQAYTGFIYGGPLWPRRVNRGLAARVTAAGLSSIQDAIGAAGEATPRPPGR